MRNDIPPGGASSHLWKKKRRGFLSAAFLAAAGLLGCNDDPPDATLSYSAFLAEAKQGHVQAVTLKGDQITLDRENIAEKDQSSGGKNAARHFTYLPPNENLRVALEGTPVDLRVQPQDRPANPLLVGGGILAGVFLLSALLAARARRNGAGRGLPGFGKPKWRLSEAGRQKTTFDDVAGMDEAREELAEVVAFLRDPGRFSKLGGRIPRGVLLQGPPGTGKTLLARAVAGEADVPFLQADASAFVEMFVGVGAARVRDLFETARKKAPCIIFIDEIDAVGRKRSAGISGGNDEREQTLNQLLIEMDGFEGTEGVIVLAATNRADVLDPALLRPKRFDRKVTVGLPDINGREKILRVHARKTPLAPDADLRLIARGTPGFSGADLENLVNEAALKAARGGHAAVTAHDLDQAWDKIIMGGDERRSVVISPEELKLTSRHEAGHAFVAYKSEHSDPIHKATIIPRGDALGFVARLPEKDRHSLSRERLKASMAVGAAGRVAEEVFFGKDAVTTGAQSDIDMITAHAHAMVTRWALSDDSALGLRAYAAGEGRPAAQSAGKAQAVDDAIDALVREAEATARTLIVENKDVVERLADALLKHETLTGQEIAAVIEGREIHPQRPAPASPLRLMPKKQELRSPLEPRG